jgi:hypothetical protein
MAVLHRAYTIDAKEFISTLEASVRSGDNVLLSRFCQLAVQIAKTPTTDTQEFLIWVRFDEDGWLIEHESETGHYFLILLAGKVSAAPSLSSRETTKGYFRELDACLQKAGWDEEEIYRLIRGDRLERMLLFYNENIANILFEQPFFKSTIGQAGVGWLSPMRVNKFYEKIKLSQRYFNSTGTQQVYQITIQMLEASINSNNDLLLILD